MLTISRALEWPETPRKPSSNVPFRRDPDLVESPALTNQIRAKVSVLAGRLRGSRVGCARTDTMSAALTSEKEVTARDRVCALAKAADASDVGALNPREQCSTLRAERTGRRRPAQALQQKGSEDDHSAAPPELAA
jgi:hypothetical protein